MGFDKLIEATEKARKLAEQLILLLLDIGTIVAVICTILRSIH